MTDIFFCPLADLANTDQAEDDSDLSKDESSDSEDNTANGDHSHTSHSNGAQVDDESDGDDEDDNEDDDDNESDKKPHCNGDAKMQSKVKSNDTVAKIEKAESENDDPELTDSQKWVPRIEEVRSLQNSARSPRMSPLLIEDKSFKNSPRGKSLALLKKGNNGTPNSRHQSLSPQKKASVKKNILTNGSQQKNSVESPAGVKVSKLNLTKSKTPTQKRLSSFVTDDSNEETATPPKVLKGTPIRNKPPLQSNTGTGLTFSMIA